MVLLDNIIIIYIYKTNRYGYITTTIKYLTTRA